MNGFIDVESAKRAEGGYVPGKEGSHCKGCVQRRVGVRARRRVHLAAAPQAVERVEQARAHEADEPEEDDLGDCACVEAHDALWPLVVLELGRVCAGMARVAVVVV